MKGLRTRAQPPATQGPELTSSVEAGRIAVLLTIARKGIMSFDAVVAKLQHAMIAVRCPRRVDLQCSGFDGCARQHDPC